MRFIQVTTTWPSGNKTVDVMRYEETEISEVFTAHENIWLNEGKMVERGDTVFVDLQRWFERTK